ncbi:hypothetical protein UlMin_026818 [Ulmus minor]
MRTASGSGEEQPKLKLYSYFRSSCSFRVRIALNLKGNTRTRLLLLLFHSFSIFLFKRKKSKGAINLQAANIVSATIQPLQNIGILKSIAEKFSQDEQLVWVNFHIGNGFTALEKLLKEYAGKYATGDGSADVFLAPQLHVGFNRLHEEYSQIPAFQDAMPEKQPDTPSQSIA